MATREPCEAFKKFVQDKNGVIGEINPKLTLAILVNQRLVCVYWSDISQRLNVNMSFNIEH